MTDLNLKKLLFIMILIFITKSGLCQNTTSSNDFWENVRFGGGIGLGFGNNYFNGSISPSAIYQVNNQFSTGVSLKFNYAQVDDVNLYAYGGSLLSFYNIIPEIQLSGELEQLRINRSLGDFEDNYWNPALFLGIGYVNKNFTIGIQYDVLHNDRKSIYSDAIQPFVRVYF